MSKLVVYNIDCKLTYKNNRDRVVIGIIKSIDKQNESVIMPHRRGRISLQGFLIKEPARNMCRTQLQLIKIYIIWL